MKTFYRWIPSLYFVQGLPATLLNNISPVLYKNFQLSNTKIAFITSLFFLPWLLKPLLAPLLENLHSKKNLIVTLQLIITTLVLLLLVSLPSTHFFYLSSLIFLSIGFAGAMYDISSDGLYIEALTRKVQAQFVGIRTMAYQLARFISQGGLIFLVGLLALTHSILFAWQIALSLFAVAMLLITFYHYQALPETIAIKPPTRTKNFSAVFKAFKALPNFVIIIAFALLYNFPESQAMKILPLFLLDKIAHGGLGLSIEWVGIIYGGVGIACLLLGITLSGFLINTFTLKRCLLPVTIFAALTSSSYLILSIFHLQSIWLIGLCIGLAQFGFGLSNGTYMLWLLYTFAKGTYSMSLYAIGTTLMVLGMMLAGALSGYMQSILGYTGFFSWILLAYIGIYLMAFYKRSCLCN